MASAAETYEVISSHSTGMKDDRHFAVIDDAEFMLRKESLMKIFMIALIVLGLMPSSPGWCQQASQGTPVGSV